MSQLTYIYLGLFLILADVSGERIPVILDLHPPEKEKLLKIGICQNSVRDFTGASQKKNKGITLYGFSTSPIKIIKVHYYSDDWKNFNAVKSFLNNLIRSKTEGVLPYPYWAEGVLISNGGILAIIEYENKITGALEIASKTHYCFQNDEGSYWWARLVTKNK